MLQRDSRAARRHAEDDLECTLKHFFWVRDMSEEFRLICGQGTRLVTNPNFVSFSDIPQSQFLAVLLGITSIAVLAS